MSLISVNSFTVKPERQSFEIDHNAYQVSNHCIGLCVV